MTLVTYNLRSGGTGRLHWSRIIEEFHPDLFFIQETVAPEDHLPPHILAEMAGRFAWTRVEGRRWGSAVYAGLGDVTAGRFARLPRPCRRPGCRRGRVARRDRSPIRAFSVHAPARGGYQKAVNQILDMIADHSGDGGLVIGGDFNLSITPRQPGEGRRTRTADLAIQRRLRDEFGLVNCWEAANPGLPPAQTLRWSNAPEVPYHCDGLFVPRSWACRLRACEVVSSPEWDRLSDHNPVVARFGTWGEATDG